MNERYSSLFIVHLQFVLVPAIGLEKFDVSSDNIQNEAFIGYYPADILDLTRERQPSTSLL
jgi:hypothetical protein